MMRLLFSLLLPVLLPLQLFAVCNTPSPTPTPTNVPTATPTPSPSSTPTPSPSPTPTLTGTGTFTEDTTTNFANPFRGVQMAGQGSGKTFTRLDAFTGATPNGTPLPLANVPTGEVVYRNYWENIMSAASTINSTTMIEISDYMTRARASWQSFNFRFIDFEPDSGIDCPTWEATANGYTSTTNGILTGQKVCNWANSNTRANWNSMLDAFTNYVESSKYQSAMTYHPTWSFLDVVGWGSYGESQYESWTITSGTAGTTINGGQEIPPLPYSGIQYNPSTANQIILLEQFGTNFPNIPLSNTMGSPYSGGMSYALSTLAIGWRGDCWGFRKLNSPSSCVGGGYTQCFLYPTELGYTVNTIDGSSALHYSENNGPVSLEVCNTLSTWTSTPYDVAQSFTWADQVGTNSVNIKNNFPAFAAFSGWEEFERGLGYRLYPATISHDSAVTAGNNLAITTTFYNRGNSKMYQARYVLAFRFMESGGNARYTYVSTDSPQLILPTSNPKTYITTVPIPTWLADGTYDVQLGIVHSDSHRPQDVRRAQIQLAVDPQPADGSFWYQSIDQVVVTNGSPTSVPVTDYAASFNGVDQYLLWEDGGSASYDAPGSSITVSARTYLTSKSGVIDRPIMTKGSPNATNQAYNLEYQQSTNNFRFSVADGTTVFEVLDTALGSPSLNTWYCIIASFNADTDTLRIRTNNGTAVTAAGPTNPLTDTANNFRIGGDPASFARLEGRIDKVRMWRRALTPTEESEICPDSDGLLSEDMTKAQLEANFINYELDEASGPRMDSFQHYQISDQGGVGQAAAH